MATVLVIEDEADLRDILSYNLARAGHRVELAGTGAEGLRIAKGQPIDVVLLDLMLSDMSGVDVCRALRKGAKTTNIGVIMLTAKGEEIDRVVGFEVGADDYVTKPFSVREFMLRIQSLLRRGSKESEATATLELGPIKVDRAAHRVTVEGEEIALTALEFKLLVTLTERKDRVQTRSVLLADVWGIDADITSRTVDTHVKRLREKLGAGGQSIETIRGVGYRAKERAGD